MKINRKNIIIAVVVIFFLIGIIPKIARYITTSLNAKETQYVAFVEKPRISDGADSLELSGELKPFLQTILTRRFDELGISGLDIDDNTNVEVGEKLYQTMSVPKIKEAVKEILLLADNLDEDDNKLEELLKTIKGKQIMDNNRVMVFSSFRHTLQYLSDKLLACGIRVGVVQGGVPDEERVKLRERFMMDKSQKEALDVLLFSEVGCEGLDYQFCDCMINYDLPWNPQAIEQRIGRIDRNGQKSESVSIINIITEGTIDCDIYDRCLSRIGVFNASIGDSEEILGDITKEIYDIAEKYVLNP